MVAPGMTTISLIGDGHIGSTLAKVLAEHGYDATCEHQKPPEGGRANVPIQLRPSCLTYRLPSQRWTSPTLRTSSSLRGSS